MDAVEARFRAATALQRRGDYGPAVAIYRALLAERPDLEIARENLCLALLGAGEYREGFALYDLRFSRTKGRVPKPQLSFPEWRGEPLAGRSLLVWMEQGFGDEIMFARFVRVLADRGGRVSILAPPPLARLFEALPAEVITAAGEVTIPRHDFWIMPGSIPGRLGTTLESLPAAPYLPGAEGGQGVGVVWRGDPRHHNDHNRSLPEALGRELLALPGAVSLLPEDSGAADFADTAARLRELALVIAVDTAVVHLAGAMGKPVWVLLPAESCDWRWMSGRSDSPWYPSARLFRQPAPGDWRPVIADVRQALAAQGSP
jgi:hypothetical protein